MSQRISFFKATTLLRSILGLKSTLFDFYVNHNPAKLTGKAYHSFTGKNDTVYIKGHGWGHEAGRRHPSQQ